MQMRFSPLILDLTCVLDIKRTICHIIYSINCISMCIVQALSRLIQ